MSRTHETHEAQAVEGGEVHEELQLANEVSFQAVKVWTPMQRTMINLRRETCIDMINYHLFTDTSTSQRPPFFQAPGLARRPNH
jgi:hypothetical protein